MWGECGVIVGNVGGCGECGVIVGNGGGEAG